jgi:Tol biopolymer transport system component
MILPLDEEKKVKPLNPSGTSRQGNSALSPDGRWLAYSAVENNSAVPHVFVEPFPPTGSKYELPEGSTAPLWSPDGKQLFYGLVGSNKIVSIDVQTTSGFTYGRPVPVSIDGLIAPGSIYSRDFDISPDGKQFIAVLEATAGQTLKQPNPQINVVLNWFEELKQRVPVK